MKRRRILYVDNNPAFLVSHRLPVAKAARDAGYEVHCACPEGEASGVLEAEGFTFHSIPLSRSGTNPLVELKTLWSILRLFITLRPDIIHLITIKPIIYGGIVANLARPKALVYAVSGLGYLFISTKRKDSYLRWLVQKLYRLAFLYKSKTVIFQNPDDRALLQSMANIPDSAICMIKGSGADLTRFKVRDRKFEAGEPIRILFAARLLVDKGINEFLQAAERVLEILESEKHALEFVIAGDCDPDNPASLSPDDISAWQVKPHFSFIGHCVDIDSHMARAQIFVLPSYREGFPKAISEAAASGLAIVTTDVPGCRDAVDGGRCGLLVPVRQFEPLAQALLQLIENAELRIELGKKAHKFAETESSLEVVVKQHLLIYRSLLGAS